MNAFVGNWDISIKTPLGVMQVRYEIQGLSDGSLTGVAIGEHETLELIDLRSIPHPDGEQVTWRQHVTKPRKHHLTFDVIVSGDELRGHSRVSILPKIPVVGRRA